MHHRGKRGRYRPIVFLLLLAALILAMAGQAAATQETEKEETDVVDLGQITVIATQPGVEITTEKTIIRMDEFKKPGEVRSLTDVLTEIGGVDVQRINPLISSPGDEVSIRGLNEGRMVIEIDGRRINHTGHNGRYIVDWSTLNMDDIERIEIIRGGHSVLHPFAIGGVINMVTKKGKLGADKKTDIKIKGGVGAYGTENLSGTINGGIGENVGYHFSASRQESDGYLRNNFQKNNSFGGHLTFHLPKDATLNLSVKYSHVNYGYPVINDPSRADYDSDYPTFVTGYDSLRHAPTANQFDGTNIPGWTRNTTYLDGIFEIPLGPGKFKFHGFATNGRRWTSTYNAGGTIGRAFSDDETRGIIAEWADVNLLDAHRFTFGAEYQELGAPEDNRSQYLVKSLYVQDVYSLTRKWTLTPGMRFYQVDMDTYYSKFGTGWPTAGKTQTEEDFYPSLKVDFQATADTALYAAVSRSYRLPCP